MEAGMSFSVKIAPGVRVRASSRGVRTSLGPRVARVHVGAGRSGISAGAGPVGFYTGIGRTRRRTSSRSRSQSVTSLQRQAAAARKAEAAAQKAEEARRLAAALSEILNVHRQEFPPAQRPIAPAPTLPDEHEVRARHEHAAMQGIGRFKRAERSAAKQRAAAAAAAEFAALVQQAETAAAQAQAELDAQWQQLLANDPDTVISTLTEAFEDNEAPAAPISVDGSEVSIAVLVPADSVVPERMPATTQAGNLTLRKLPKGDRASLYMLLVAGCILVTLREAFAVAPGINTARVVTLRAGGADAYGKPRLECITAGRWTRAAFEGVRWEDADAGTTLHDTADELAANIRRAQLLPIDLSKEPQIAGVLASIDTAELLSEQ
jgi:hypothetical protein